MDPLIIVTPSVSRHRHSLRASIVGAAVTLIIAVMVQLVVDLVLGIIVMGVMRLVAVLCVSVGRMLMGCVRHVEGVVVVRLVHLGRV